MDKGPVWILLDSSGIGGIETHVTSLTAALRAQCINAELVLLDDHGLHPLEDFWSEVGIPVLKICGGLRGLFLNLLKKRPALVHTHGYKAGIVGRLFCRLLRVPVVSTFHAGEPGVGRVKFYNMVDVLTGCMAEAIAVSSLIARRLRHRADVIPNFVNLPDDHTPVGNSIAFVGRLSHEKGPDRFIELAKALPKHQFKIFGDGPMFDTLSKRAAGSVVFHGAVSTMQPYWKHIGLLCISSRYEGLPLVALEAMSHGVPVAAFGVGALPDVIDHRENGFLVPEGNMKAMKLCLQEWHDLENGRRDAMSKSARTCIKDHYSNDVIIPRVLAVYGRALRHDRTDTGHNSDVRPSGAIS